MKIIVNGSLQYVPENANTGTTRPYLPSAAPYTIAGSFGRVNGEVADLSLLTLNHSVLDIYEHSVIQITDLTHLHLCFLLQGNGALINQAATFNEEQIAYNFWPDANYHIAVKEGQYSFLLMEVRSELYPLLSSEYPFLHAAGGRQPRIPMSVQVQQAIHQVLNIQESGELGRINLDAAANRLFFLTLKEVGQQQSNKKITKQIYNHDDNVLSEIAAYINDNLDERLTIEIISRKFNLSRSKLLETFKNAFGQPLHDYIITRRIEKAKVLLQEGYSLLDVCYQVGYPDKSNFVRAFKNATGTTPASYRKQFFSNRTE